MADHHWPGVLLAAPDAKPCYVCIWSQMWTLHEPSPLLQDRLQHKLRASEAEPAVLQLHLASKFNAASLKAR